MKIERREEVLFTDMTDSGGKKIFLVFFNRWINFGSIAFPGEIAENCVCPNGETDLLFFKLFNCIVLVVFFLV